MQPKTILNLAQKQKSIAYGRIRLLNRGTQYSFPLLLRFPPRLARRLRAVQPLLEPPNESLLPRGRPVRSWRRRRSALSCSSAESRTQSWDIIPAVVTNPLHSQFPSSRYALALCIGFERLPASLVILLYIITNRLRCQAVQGGMFRAATQSQPRRLSQNLLNDTPPATMPDLPP